MLIEAKHLEKRYQQGDKSVTIFEGLNLQIQEGEFLAIMGPSGSGKSTLLNSLSTIDAIDSGSLYFEGKDISQLSEDELADLRRLEMGFIFQSATLLNHLNVQDNIILPHLLRNKRNYSVLFERCQDLLRKVGLADMGECKVQQLSGGQLQRVGIARALLGNPKVIFADEPTGALNSQTSQEIVELLKRYNRKGIAVVIVTHDVKVASVANRVLILTDGMIREDLDMIQQGIKQDTQRLRWLGEKLFQYGV